MQLAGRGRIRHLFFEDLEAEGSGLERRPVGSRAEDRLVLVDDLVVEDANAAGQVPLRIEDGLLRVVRWQVFVSLPVEGAAVPFAVFIGELQEPFLVNDATGDTIGYGDFRFGMADIGCGIESGLGRSHGLEEIGPPGALIGFAHGVEGGAIAADITGHAMGEHDSRQRALDEDVPALVPCGTAEHGGFVVQRRGRGDFDSGGGGRSGGDPRDGLGIGLGATSGTAEKQQHCRTDKDGRRSHAKETT